MKSCSAVIICAAFESITDFVPLSLRHRSEGCALIWKRNDINRFSVLLQRGKIKPQVSEYAIQSRSIRKRKDVKTERFGNVFV